METNSTNESNNTIDDLNKLDWLFSSWILDKNHKIKEGFEIPLRFDLGFVSEWLSKRIENRVNDLLKFDDRQLLAYQTAYLEACTIIMAEVLREELQGQEHFEYHNGKLERLLKDIKILLEEPHQSFIPTGGISRQTEIQIDLIATNVIGIYNLLAHKDGSDVSIGSW